MLCRSECDRLCDAAPLERSHFTRGESLPVAAYGGYRFLRRLTGSRGASLWGAAAYGLLPVLTGAVQQGRLGTVADGGANWLLFRRLSLRVRQYLRPIRAERA